MCFSSLYCLHILACAFGASCHACCRDIVFTHWHFIFCFCASVCLMTFIACSSAAWGGQQHTPQTMASSSPLSVWWCCGKCGHEWRATVISRTSNKDGCPHCCAADFKPLSVTHPELAAEWHELNKDMIVKKGSRIPNEIVGTPLTPATCSKYVLAHSLRCRFYVIFARKGYWLFLGFTSLTRRGPAFRSCYRFCPSRAAGKNVGFSSFLLLFALANTISKDEARIC